MESETGAARSPSLSLEPAHSNHTTTNRAQTSASHASKRPSTSSGMSSPLSSAPSTPYLNSTYNGRPSHAATSPLNPTSPRLPQTLRRASSTQSLKDRPPSSPNVMKRTGSRSSLSGQFQDEERNKPSPKRSISNLIAGLRESHSKMEAIEEPIPLTAQQIAIEHFTRELVAHANPNATAETVVILHDACYGHRYSRLKTTKSTLSMIVERPERIHASVLGASTAYVRLGSHHASGRNAPHPDRTLPAPPPFKIRRTGRALDITSSCVTNVHGTSWMTELRSMCHSAGEKLAAGMKELSRTTTDDEPEKRRLHEGDLYLCTESLNAFQGALGGVADAVDTVLSPASQTKRSFVAIRPPGHHCSADYPSGFCWLNNVHVGIEYAAQQYGLTHAAIIDFDLHHGDGSQAITWERNSKNNMKRQNAKPNNKPKLGPDIGYYSLHDINSYPCEMGDDEKVQAASLCIENAHGQSVWNVHLQPWKTQDEFWQLYESQYRVLLDKARIFLRHHTARLSAEGKVQPKAAIFISAGFDASEWEGAGMQRHNVNVPTEFYARFTRDIVELAQEEGCGCDGRVVSVLEGGYSDRALCSGVLSHLSGLCAVPWQPTKEDSQTSAMGLDRMMRGLGIHESAPQQLQYDKMWWSTENLTALGLKIEIPPPPPQAKKVRTGREPTYATPTESFAYKVVDPNKFARSISGTMRDVARPVRAPTPPPPEVDWVVAAQELSKLLIPMDRQTKSCTPEELAGVRTKKDRQSAMPALPSIESAQPRQLRDRKTKAPAYSESPTSDDLESLRSASRNSRRRTVSDLPLSDQPDTSRQGKVNRRLSTSSTVTGTNERESNPPPVPPLPATAAIGAMKPAALSAPGVQVKKARAPLKPKSTAITSAPVSPSRSTKPTLPVSKQPKDSTIAPGEDMDALTTGLKKITLKVGTRDDHDKKQKEKLDAERRARALKGAETRRVNAAAKKAAMESTGPKPVAKKEVHVNNGPVNAKPATEPAATVNPEARTERPMHTPVTTQAASSELLMPDYTSGGFANGSDAAMPTSQQVRNDHTHTPNRQSNYTPSLNGPLPYEQIYTNPAFPPSHAQEPVVPLVPNPAAQKPIHEHAFANVAPFIPQAVALVPSAHQQPPENKLPIWSSHGPIPFASSADSPTTLENPWRQEEQENLMGGQNGIDEKVERDGRDHGMAWGMAPPVQQVQEEESVWVGAHATQK